MQVGDVYISRRTFALLVGGLSLMLVIAVAGLSVTSTLPEAQSSSVLSLMTDLSAILFGVMAAVLLIRVGHTFRPGNPLRRIWLLIGFGIAAYAVGDVIWAVLDIGSGFTEVPYPSAADFFYLAMYGFLVAGLVLAAMAFARMARVRRPIAAAVVLTSLAAIAVFALVVLPVASDASTDLAARLLGVAYPMGDMVFLLGPAIFIVLAAPAVGPFRVVRQWWVLALGLALMSLSDIGFTWLDWTGRYFTGHPVDFGWMASLLLIAIAGSLAADVAESQGAHPGAHGATLATVPVAEAPEEESVLEFTAPGVFTEDEIYVS